MYIYYLRCWIHSLDGPHLHARVLKNGQRNRGQSDEGRKKREERVRDGEQASEA